MPVKFTNKPAAQSIAQKPDAPAKAKKSRKRVVKAYPLATYERLFNYIADGEDLTSACRHQHMPSPRTARRRFAADDVLKEQFDRANSIRLHGLADQLVGLPDAAIAGYEKVSAADRLTAAKQKADNIKWILARGLAEYAGIGEDSQQVVLNIVNSPDARPAPDAPAQVVPLQPAGPQLKIVGLPAPAAQSIAQTDDSDGDTGNG